ncbi:hypothetical protein [Thalassobaculum salexigens]|uniref:hypothetical protein n=1 Tax=Thalassobaculum salexigens TaxID=455360 RepID=UPI00248DFED8|nr:hypothetical protein [Thalassobaculum salexigens]
MHLPRPRAMRTDAAAHVGPPGTRRMGLSVVIAANGDADQLARCLAALVGTESRGLDLETIVVDPDGNPDLAAVAEARGATLITLPASRGARLAAGAKAATADWLLLLRAETVLERGWDATVVVFAAEERNRERGGFFPLDVVGDPLATRLMRFRNRWMGLPSGAQGLVIRRRFLVHLEGVADLERGEDLILARALGLARMVVFDVAARVEAGDWPTGAGAVLLGALRIFLFRLHIPARWLQRLGD